ncbi:MAG: PP2C family protein-serine/threonine phosphatase [Tepidisphaeraceae bacterium]
MAQTRTQLMQCMEVWGGNEAFDSDVSIPGLDAWVYSKPYQQAHAGGDVYYVSSCATGRIARLLVADVSGHGAGVAAAAAELRALMRRYVNRLDQRQFVRSMNEQFAQLSQAGTFATAVVTTFFGPTNFLTICNAGHPRPLRYRFDRREWTLLEGRRSTHAGANIPLGILDLASYDQFGVQLGVGDLVMCYTDSLIESRDSRGEMLTEAGLLELVRQIGADEPASAIPRLIAAITERDADNLEADDVTVLLFRPNGTMPGVPLRDKFLAPLRVIGGAVSALRESRAMPLPDLSIANIGGALFGPLNRVWGRNQRDDGS